MHSMSLFEQPSAFDSKREESNFSISLANHRRKVTVDFEANPNLVLEIEEFRGVVGLSSAAQAGFLINHDHSCWVTNIGRNGSTEVYRPGNKTYRRLANQQVAYLRHGDYVGFYGAFYRLEFSGDCLTLAPVEFVANSAT